MGRGHIPPLRMMLVDADPAFRRRVGKAARSLGVEFASCGCLARLRQARAPYDMAVIGSPGDAPATLERARQEKEPGTLWLNPLHRATGPEGIVRTAVRRWHDRLAEPGHTGMTEATRLESRRGGIR